MTKQHPTEQNVTPKAANHLTKAKFGSTQGSGSHSSPQRGFRIHINREELYKEYMMQAKQLCTNQKSTEGKFYQPPFVLLHREGRWLFSSAHPLRNNPAAKLTDLITTWPDFIKKKIKIQQVLFCGFLEPSGVWKVFYAGSLV